MKKLNALAGLVFLALLTLCVAPAYAQLNITTISSNNTITADDDFVEFIIPSNTPSITITLTGTFTSTNRVDATSFNSETRWSAGSFVSGIPVIQASDNSSDTTQTAVGTWILGNVGWQRVRVYGTNWTSGTVVVSAVAGQGGVSSGGGGGGAGDASAANQTLQLTELQAINANTLAFNGMILHATSEPLMPLLLPTIAYNADGTVASFGTVNYHDNAPLVSQDGIVSLCKSWAGAPTALSFDTNLTMENCTPQGERRVTLSTAGANLTATTISAIKALDVNVANAPINPCADPAKLIVLPIDATAASGTIEYVAASGSNRVRLCGYHIQLGGAGDAILRFGSGTTCGTNTANLRVINAVLAGDGAALELLTPWDSVAARAFCINRTTAVTLKGGITYAFEL